MSEARMSPSSAEYASAINDLISVCKDAEQGFHGAAQSVNDPALREIFERLSQQRAGFASELQGAVKQAGIVPAHPAGASGMLHGGWMKLKGILTGHSPHQILEETERGEDLSMRTYRDALATSMPAELRSLVERQFEQVRQAHARIKALRDTAAQK